MAQSLNRKEQYYCTLIERLAEHEWLPIALELWDHPDGRMAFYILEDYFLKHDPPVRSRYADLAALSLHRLVDEHVADLESFRTSIELLLDHNPSFGLN